MFRLGTDCIISSRESSDGLVISVTHVPTGVTITKTTKDYRLPLLLAMVTDLVQLVHEYHSTRIPSGCSAPLPTDSLPLHTHDIPRYCPPIQFSPVLDTRGQEVGTHVLQNQTPVCPVGEAPSPSPSLKGGG